MRYSAHMSRLSAAATVNGMEAITASIKAFERQGSNRLECLHEAKENVIEFLRDIEAAIAAETHYQTEVDNLIRRRREIIAEHHSQSRSGANS